MGHGGKLRRRFVFGKLDRCFLEIFSIFFARFAISHTKTRAFIGENFASHHTASFTSWETAVIPWEE
ncbi:MAG TPA: hypothetical protein DDW73_09675 [Rhizobium sp.]|jgi:hypothetical protein|nr:hypothetical protein [Rhizobium sp.]